MPIVAHSTTDVQISSSLTTLFAWLKECEERLDLSEPLASDLYLPSRKEDLFIDSP
jgi:hypothetical protein